MNNENAAINGGGSGINGENGGENRKLSRRQRSRQRNCAGVNGAWRSSAQRRNQISVQHNQ
jgi:hypothetical protein